MMTTKTRVPNKIQWALADMSDTINDANYYWRVAQARAESEMDGVQMAALARLRDRLAQLERLVVNAQQGEYVEERPVQLSNNGRRPAKAKARA